MKPYWLFAALILLAAGCTQGEGSLRKTVSEAGLGVSSYSTDIRITMNMTVLGADRGLMLTGEVWSSGFVDRGRKEAVTETRAKSRALTSEYESDSVTYAKGGYLYSRRLGSWSRARLDDALWQKQDHLSLLTGLLETGKVRKVEKAGDYTVVTLEPERAGIVALALGGQPAPVGGSPDGLASAVKKASATLWIGRETGLVEKAMSFITMEVDSPSASSGSAQKIELEYAIESRIGEINSKREFALPAEAANATEVAGLGDVDS